MTSLKALAAYLLLAFAASWALQFGAIATVGDLEARAAVPWLLAAMATPGLTVLLLMVLSPQVRRAVTWKPRWSLPYLAPIAIAVPALIAFTVVAIALTLGWGAPGWFEFNSGGVSVSGGPWLLGRGVQAWPLFLANVAVTATAYALFSAIPAIGEELGWRGFLQGALVERLGLTRGVVLVGVIWSLWHLPGLLAGYNYPEHPVLGAFVLFPLELVGVSFFMAWLTLRTKSFWPAAIAHGAGNSIQEGVTANLHLTVPRLYEDLTTVGLSLVVGLIAWGLLTAGRKSRQNPSQP